MGGVEGGRRNSTGTGEIDEGGRGSGGGGGGREYA